VGITELAGLAAWLTTYVDVHLRKHITDLMMSAENRVAGSPSPSTPEN
jgi:hypothetical protein